MKIKQILMFSAFGMLLLSSCGNSNEPGVKEVQADGKISSIIRNPVTADGEVDTINVARLKFTETEFDFGQIEEGDVVNHTFSFTNTGRVPLVISGAKSSCGCTVPTWPKDPIPPGEGGVIEVQFNSKTKQNQQRKPVKITANTYPSETVIYLSGFVNPRSEEPDSE